MEKRGTSTASPERCTPEKASPLPGAPPFSSKRCPTVCRLLSPFSSLRGRSPVRAARPRASPLSLPYSAAPCPGRPNLRNRTPRRRRAKQKDLPSKESEKRKTRSARLTHHGAMNAGNGSPPRNRGVDGSGLPGITVPKNGRAPPGTSPACKKLCPERRKATAPCPSHRARRCPARKRQGWTNCNISLATFPLGNIPADRLKTPSTAWRSPQA